MGLKLFRAHQDAELPDPVANRPMYLETLRLLVHVECQLGFHLLYMGLELKYSGSSFSSRLYTVQPGAKP